MHDRKPNWTLLVYTIIYLLIKAIIVGRYARRETGYPGDYTRWGFGGISLHGWGSGDSSPQFLQSSRVWGWGRWVCITAQSWWKIPFYWSQVSLNEGISPMVFIVKNVSSYLPDKKYKFSPPLTPLLCNVLKEGKAQTVGLSKATIIVTVLFIEGRPRK